MSAVHSLFQSFLTFMFVMGSAFYVYMLVYELRLVQKRKKKEQEKLEAGSFRKIPPHVHTGRNNSAFENGSGTSLPEVLRPDNIIELKHGRGTTPVIV